MIHCQICQKEFQTIQALSCHVRQTHQISAKEYYDKYLRKDDKDGFCHLEGCNNPTKFHNANVGYSLYCCNSHAQKSPEITQKRSETYFNKTGYHHNFQNPENLKKQKQTCLERYGVEYYHLTEEFQEKSKQTKKERYGDENFNNRDKAKETNLEKYGVQCTFNRPEIIEKIKKESKEIGSYIYFNKEQANETIKKKYGEHREKIMEKVSETAWKTRIKNIEDLLKEYNITDLKLIDCKDKSWWIFKCLKCNEEFIIERQMFDIRLKGKQIICNICHPYREDMDDTSQDEEELREFIKANYTGKIVSTRNEIYPLEIDIYLPDLKLGFEYNGLYWHSTAKNSNTIYHQIKTDKCEAKGIHLIHIWEDDWKYKKDIVKSRILNLLGQSKKIYARNCILKEINYQEKHEFLENNHIQGDCTSKVNLGLYYKNELISIMTLGNYRFNKDKKETPKDCYELLRFCNKCEYTVIGGASKLFKYFLIKWNPIKIGSYADRCWTTTLKPSLYENLGFKKEKTAYFNYWYFGKLGIRENRINYQKWKLIQEGYDPNKTEYEIMLERGYFRIYGAGEMKFVYLP